MNTYNYAGIEAYDINNGKGFGVTFFVQGCPHHCKGCHNPSTWAFDDGRPIDFFVIDELNRLFRDENIVRLTISGGEPFANITSCEFVASLFKEAKPYAPIWIYTGYTYEELSSLTGCKTLLELCDVLVDGPYQEESRDLSLPFRGSRNQRIIDVKKSLAQNAIVPYTVD